MAASEIYGQLPPHHQIYLENKYTKLVLKYFCTSILAQGEYELIVTKRGKKKLKLRIVDGGMRAE